MANFTIDAAVAVAAAAVGAMAIRTAMIKAAASSRSSNNILDYQMQFFRQDWSVYPSIFNIKQ